MQHDAPVGDVDGGHRVRDGHRQEVDCPTGGRDGGNDKQRHRAASKVLGKFARQVGSDQRRCAGTVTGMHRGPRLVAAVVAVFVAMSVAVKLGATSPITLALVGVGVGVLVWNVLPKKPISG
ncbi:hypothetical protein Lfu02_79820 [Longispora fulva]|nr:hypothetical protein Lfu02_79820 [Longispora fulva]